jgi:hypothetical protein
VLNIYAQTRITTKYNIPNLDTLRYQSDRKRKRDNETEGNGTTAAPRIPRGTITLKAFDPESGVTLKFKTDKSADVGRMFAGLGRVGRIMAALPEKIEGIASLYSQARTRAHHQTAQDMSAEDVEVSGQPTVEAQATSNPQVPTTAPETKPANGPKKKKKGKK